MTVCTHCASSAAAVRRYLGLERAGVLEGLPTAAIADRLNADS